MAPPDLDPFKLRFLASQHIKEATQLELLGTGFELDSSGYRRCWSLGRVERRAAERLRTLATRMERRKGEG